MNISSIYPKGVEKARNCSNNNAISPELKEKALEMLAKGLKSKYIAQTLGICEATVCALKNSKERY